MKLNEYHCIACRYEAEIPYEVLMEISNGKLNKNKMPLIKCPYCSGFLKPVSIEKTVRLM